jgi:hypothetical protein
MAEIEGPRRPGSALAWLAAGAVTAVILGFGAALGLWFLPFVAGLAAGIAPWRARRALALVVLAVVVGWGAALWWPALSGAPAGATARVLAALAGLPPHAAVGVAATLLVGVLQGLVAVWLARAVTHRLPRTVSVGHRLGFFGHHRTGPDRRSSSCWASGGLVDEHWPWERAAMISRLSWYVPWPRIPAYLPVPPVIW